MVYNMRLNDEPFIKMKAGKKTIELRLFDGKRRKLDIGDYIIFKNLKNGEELAVVIKALFRFESFRDLYVDIPMEMCGNNADISEAEFVNRMRNYYSEVDEKRYGVLGIKIALIDLEEARDIEGEIAGAEYERFFPDGIK